MKRKMTKLLSAAMAGVMVLGMTACGKQDETPGSSGTTSASTPVSTPASSQTPEPKKEEVPDSPKTLDDYEKASGFNYYNIAAGVSDDEFNASAMAKMIDGYTGYNVVYAQAPADATASQDAITNIFLLKQDYQAVKVSKDQFYTLLALDALAPVTEYVNATKNLKAEVSQFGWDMATKDGEIYGIPQKNAMASSSVGICYRVDWLAEYNNENASAQIPVPSEENGYSMTISDFKTMLQYFKTKVPEGGYAMAIDTNGVFLENILPAFGIYQDWADVNGELTYVINQPGFSDYAVYMQDLYDEGLILYQATSDDAGAVKSLQARNVGAGRVAHWNAYAIETTNAPEGTELSDYTDDTIGYIEALVPDDCRGDASKVRVYAAEGYGYFTVIPNYTKPEQIAAVVDWIDKKLDEDFFLKLVLGTEGTTFSVENGEYYPVLPAFNDEQALSDKFMDGSREADYAKYWLCRTRKTGAQNKMFSTVNYNIENTGIQNPITVMPPNETYDTYYNAANSEVKNVIVTSMYKSDTPFDLAAVQAKWKEYEGDTITTSVNEWYKAWSNKDSFNSVKPR